MFPETADIETSSEEYAARFAGPTGAWMLQIQETIVRDLLKSLKVTIVLDVGGGHGQLALPLCRAGFPVTVVASAESCRRQISPLVDSGQCRFVVGNLIELPFSDRSFDAVLCFRLMSHCERWPQLIRELCRVARQAVIFDYPTSQSLNRLAPQLFGAKKKLEGNTRTFRLFRHDELAHEFIKHDFRAGRRIGQFFLPMVLHRMLKCQPLSATLESACRGTGLSRRWGSPVILEMLRESKR
ncbi:MAG: class I SAM-dependent methyltransferase [Verrucomicrobia bacterium]|nr:class I SAM-dependent methyltransferase [Verrucomicrobiota bacterium]MCG2681653.1 class I SAM-dependent methyltransferase [Kiritimatiellia bacterium]MBU4248105.1 class I SAM-dependent methyltransferase [Verrucomicrobiota bacterium]MBU4290781.1 class I SAM-dependent methyltransferase [Verrucomicrobiota bacterium]MBU4429744.1 class I SAM-dependent methyltransferase [Verrucomicrobiota bacterium]